MSQQDTSAHMILLMLRRQETIGRAEYESARSAKKCFEFKSV
jgi:hypothetical protein